MVTELLCNTFFLKRKMLSEMVTSRLINVFTTTYCMPWVLVLTFSPHYLALSVHTFLVTKTVMYYVNLNAYSMKSKCNNVHVKPYQLRAF